MTAIAADNGKNFGGVGIDGIRLPNGQIRVAQLVVGGPAHLSGIRIGDTITEIDGKATLGGDFQAMVQKRLRGVAGTQVVLRIRREGEDKPLTFVLKRRRIDVIPVNEKQ